MNDTPPTEQAECLMQNGVDDDDTMTQLGAIGRKKKHLNNFSSFVQLLAYLKFK